MRNSSLFDDSVEKIRLLIILLSDMIGDDICCEQHGGIFIVRRSGWTYKYPKRSNQKQFWNQIKQIITLLIPWW